MVIIKSEKLHRNEGQTPTRENQKDKQEVRLLPARRPSVAHTHSTTQQCREDLCTGDRWSERIHDAV